MKSHTVNKANSRNIIVKWHIVVFLSTVLKTSSCHLKTILINHAYIRIKLYAIDMRFHLPCVVKLFLNLLFHLTAKF